MKPAFFVIVILLLTTTLFLETSSAQGLSPDMTVRVIYFLPWQQPPDPNINTRVDSMVKEVQTLYADEMERYGYGRKTFTLETDTQGNTVVHRLDGLLDDKNYLEYSWKVWDEVTREFDLSKNVYLVLLQISTEVLDGGKACGLGSGGSVRGGGLVPSSGPCFNTEIVGHELGHAFGLMHDFHSDTYIMSYGLGTRERISPCHAEWLNDHRAFNPGSTSTSETVGIQHLSTNLVSPPNKLSLRFEMTHHDGLRHAQLTAFPTAKAENPDNLKILTCEHVEGRRDIVEFVTTELTASANTVMLNVMDIHGNISQQWIPINISGLLPKPRSIPIPDPNLAAAIRRELELNLTSTITELDMLGLKSLDATKQGITNLSGLEHAPNLKYLYAWDNQIRDITPLTKSTQLTYLAIPNNQITDARPLTNLTNLNQLYLGGNQITDITPLAKLVELKDIHLWNNQIRDITPLAKLTQLANLNLANNQITNVQPLAKLTQLMVLSLFGNQIQDVTPLAKLVELKELFIAGNPIQDASPLAKLTKLVEIDIDIDDFQPERQREDRVTTRDNEPTETNVKITVTTPDDEPTDADVEISIPDQNLAAAVRKTLNLGPNAPLTKQTMKRLTALDAQRSQIKSLAGLEHATRLEFLELRDNQIKGLRPLTHLKNLKTLVLDNNKVKNIKPLAEMTQLTWLLLGNNRISDFTPIANLTELGGLSLWGYDLKDVNLLAGMTELTHLWIGWNKISNITALAKLTNLQVLSLHDNKIRDIRPLVGLKKLQELSLAQNPIDDMSQLRQLLKQNPKLKLDIHPDEGPKIEGPWVWMIVPTGNIGGKDAAASGKDWLAAASKGTVTEQKIATKGATAGTRLKNRTWRLGRLSPTGSDNITEMVNNIGLGTGNIDNHVAYGSLALRSPRKQKTKMYVGSDDAVKVWLNGTLVHNNPINRPASHYQESFTVTLKKGKNILLVAVYQFGGWWSGFFGFKNDAAYSVITPSAPRVAAAPVNNSPASAIPEATLLLTNYPNPFNPETWIPYHLSKASDVKITIYDTHGVIVRRLALGINPAGIYTSRDRAVYWDGCNSHGEPVASGIYFYQLQTGEASSMRKMVILK